MIRIKSLQDALAKPAVFVKPAPTINGKTAVISAHFGGFSEIRREATLRAVRAWEWQSSLPDDALILELVCPGQTPCFSRNDFPEWVQYVRIFGNERNRNLFQKEALWNIGAKLTNANKLLFLDGDCEPVNCRDYFKQVFDACVPGKCVHAAWHIIHEGQPDNCHDFWSIMATDTAAQGKPTFPGMGYAITRQDYEAMDGFNPFSICGSGDMVFIWESLKCLNQKIPFARRFHTGLIRPNRPQLTPVAIPGLTVRHNYHGLKSDRGYIWSRYAVEVFGDPRAYCHIDSGGLLAWNDPMFPLKYIVMEKSRMHTKEELLSLICEVFKKRLDEQEQLNKNKDYHYDPTDSNIYA